MTRDDEALDSLIDNFLDTTLDELGKLSRKTETIEDNQIKTKFVDDWTSLFSIFKTDHERIQGILDELKKFVFPAIEQDYTSRVKILYEEFYQQSSTSQLVKEIYRKMVYQFITDFISTSKEWIIDDDTYDILKKFMNILKTSD